MTERDRPNVTVWDLPTRLFHWSLVLLVAINLFFISPRGGNSTVVHFLVGFAIGQAFDGTVVPLVVGTLVCGLATLAVVALAERGRLFQPGRDIEADAPGRLLQGGGS